MRRFALLHVVLLVLAAGSLWQPSFAPAFLRAQGSAPPAPLVLVTRDGRRTVPTTIVSGQELIGLDEVAALFQVVVREDALAGGVTVTYRGRTIVASADQPMASVNGRVVSLPSPIVRSGRRWLVPLEFLPRALGPIYDQRIELRRPQRLLLVGDVRVPRVTARIDAAGPPTRATIDVAPAATVAVVSDAARVLIRIDADALDLALPPSGAGLIEQIRAADQPNTILIVLTAAAGAARIAQSTSDGATHVTVEVPSAAPAATPSIDTATAPRPPISPEPATAPHVGFQTVVIDPGHGGDETGVKAAGGLEEKTFTLDIAHRLRAMLEMRMGVRVVLTRDDDRVVPLDARAAIANSSKADLFLSLHVNGSPSPMVSGAEVYHLKLDQEGEDVRRQAEADAVTLPVLGGGTRTLEVIRWDMAQARHLSESARLATLIAEELGKQKVAMSRRGVQEAPLRVLEGADTPAALVEMLYATNAAQEKAAGTDEFKNALTQSLFSAIARFRGYTEDPAGR